jgi:hypothetical protein
MMDTDGTLVLFKEPRGSVIVTLSVTNKSEVNLVAFKARFGGSEICTYYPKKATEGGAAVWNARNNADVKKMVQFFKQVPLQCPQKAKRLQLITRVLALKAIPPSKRSPAWQPEWEALYREWNAANPKPQKRGPRSPLGLA